MRRFVVSVFVASIACVIACGGKLVGSDGLKVVACPSSDPSGTSCSAPGEIECPRTYTDCNGDAHEDTCTCTGQALWGCPLDDSICNCAEGAHCGGVTSCTYPVADCQLAYDNTCQCVNGSLECNTGWCGISGDYDAGSH